VSDTVYLLFVVAAILVPVCGVLGVLGAVLFFVIRRNVGQAKSLATDWAALAQRQGFTFDPGDLLRSPTLSGLIDGQTVRLTFGSYQMGSGGLSYRYTQAVALVSAVGEVWIADRRRQHHVERVSGAEVGIGEPQFAASHVAVGQPVALVEALLTPALLARYRQLAISHVRLAGGQLLVQRPGHTSAEADSLALMQLAAEVAGIAAASR
jgi:hypothetical protein